MSVVLTIFLNWLDWLDQLPLWAIYLILFLLSIGAWYLVGLAFVSIARSMG